MDRLLKIISFFLIFGSLQAQQNLVPNWSFENITTCPTFSIFTSTLPFAFPWQNPTQGTPDIFSSCDTAVPTGWSCPVNGVPCNGAGNQMPHSGNNYSGIYCWGQPELYPGYFREYPQIKLSDSLIKNKKYCASFFVSLAERSSYSTSRLGCLFTNSPVTNTTQDFIFSIPQISNAFNNYISDTINWTEIRGLYTSSGGENYITIGNFFDNTNTDTLFIGGRYGHLDNNIYYYIDDVSLVEYISANAGRDSNICAGIKIKQNVGFTFGAQYNWSVLNGDFNSIDSANISSPSFSPTVTTTYVLQKWQCGILSYDTLFVRIPLSYPAKVGNDTSICIGDTIFLSAVNNCSWCNHLWSTGGNTSQISVHPLDASNYQFYQTDSCHTTTDAITVNVEYCKSPIVTAPNIFTPNADGINDMWQPIIANELSILQYSLIIYDRWGLKVFEADKYNEGWDGYTISGLECNEGTYYYVIYYTDGKTKAQNNLKGFLQLSK